MRSNHLSYRPIEMDRYGARALSGSDPTTARNQYLQLNQVIEVSAWEALSIVKEVIQPQVPLGLPCYDFTPVMNHTVVTVPHLRS